MAIFTMGRVITKSPMGRVFMHFGVSPRIESLTFIKEDLKMGNTTDLVSCAK